MIQPSWELTFENAGEYQLAITYTEKISSARVTYVSDVITVKVYRAEGMQDFYEHQDLSKVGEGEYLDLTITLRVIDNVTM